MYSIEKTKVAVAGIFALINATDRAAQNGIGIDDAPLLMGPISAMPGVLAALKDVPNELGDLNAEEKKELMDFVGEKFDIADDKLEVAIEETMKALMQLKSAYEAIRVAMA